eukprot:UN07328
MSESIQPLTIILLVVHLVLPLQNMKFSKAFKLIFFSINIAKQRIGMTCFTFLCN